MDSGPLHGRFVMPQEEHFNSFWTRFLYRGGAGILAALFLILLFILFATWFRPVAFGLMLAYLFLPLEKLYEWLLFRTKRTARPSLRRVAAATMASVLSLCLVLTALTMAVVSQLIPMVVDKGRELAEWTRNRESVQVMESRFSEWLNSEKGKIVVSGVQAKMGELIGENKGKLALFALSGGKNVLSGIVNLVSQAGSMAGELLLTLLFFFYFLQKMAMIDTSQTRSRQGNAVARWIVDTMYQSAWLPPVSEQTKQKAEEVLSRIGGILSRWLRGYFLIVAVETVLYTALFVLARVPYALLAGPVAGCAILIPLVGFIGSILLTLGLCLVFCEGQLLLTLILVVIIYGLVCILEQTVLYPRCIGGALGLTTLETIIVVLAGVMLFGFAGMLLALPSAAVIKCLVPEIYGAMRGETLSSAENIPPSDSK